MLQPKSPKKGKRRIIKMKELRAVKKQEQCLCVCVCVKDRNKADREVAKAMHKETRKGS